MQLRPLLQFVTLALITVPAEAQFDETLDDAGPGLGTFDASPRVATDSLGEVFVVGDDAIDDVDPWRHDAGSMQLSQIPLSVTGGIGNGTFVSAAMPNLAIPRHELIHPFGNTAFGIFPHARLTQGLDGALYGTAHDLGRRGQGTVFKVKTDGSGVLVLADFDYSIGADLPGAVVQGSDGALYGTTFYGGCGFYGTVFKVNPDGSNFLTLHSFSYSDGAYFHVGLVEGSDGAMYGTTVVGGGHDSGTVFKLNLDGSGFTTLHSFNAITDGTGSSVLIEGTDGALYGANEDGGTHGHGTVYRLNLDGTGFTTIHHFDSDIGGSPRAGVLEGADGMLYGTAYGVVYPSSSGIYGTVYRLNKDGSGFTTLHSFDFFNDGAGPNSELIQDAAGALYGTTSNGGGFGTVFEIDPDGSNFSTLHNFTGVPSDGRNPQDGVILAADGKLYGTTIYGGSSNRGTVFKINRDGAGFAQLLNFYEDNSYDDAKGSSPGGVPALGTDGRIYGTASSGGLYGSGTVYAVSSDGNGFTTLHDFDPSSSEGGSPDAGVLEGADGALYGTTAVGGVGYGTVFQLQADGSAFATVHEFNGSDGAHPSGELIQLPDGKLYGTTKEGGSNSSGTVFRMNPDGTGFATVHHFDSSSEGASPDAGVLEGMDGALYGTTRVGGSGYGTAFRLNPDGSGFVTLHAFDDSDGAYPTGELIQGMTGTLYGTTDEGGSNSAGTVFRMNPDGTGLATLHHFDNTDGTYARGHLAEADGVLYGTTAEGGINGYGTAFGLRPDGTEFTTMLDFDGSANGSHPFAGLVRGADGNLYGTTTQGGSGELGTVFRLVLSSPPVANAGADLSVNEGQTVMLDASASSVSNGAELQYSWQQTVGTVVTLSNSIAAQPTFTAPFVAQGGETLSFRLTVMVDSSHCATDTVNVTVNPAQECWLFLAPSPGSATIGNSPVDLLLVRNISGIWPVTIPTVPSLPIPNWRPLLGVDLYFQVAMYNPSAFPNDPLQMSNGLKVTIGGDARRYGVGSGLDLWAPIPAVLGGSFRPAFRIAR